MSNIEFQNGFLAGMATKGMIKSGQAYAPEIWNDPGVYSYFYIDFKRILQPFSLGMFLESERIVGNTMLSVNAIEHISQSIYKVHCDLSGQEQVEVSDSTFGWLSFVSGDKLPAFSVSFVPSGITSALNQGIFATRLVFQVT